MLSVKVVVCCILLSVGAWAATSTAVTATTSTSNTNSYTSSAFTPAANDQLQVFVVISGNAAASPTLTDSQSLGFTLVTFARKASSADSIYLFTSNALAANSSMTVTFATNNGNATGCIIAPYRISGMSRVGMAAIRQTQTQSNQSAGTPAPAFSVAALTGNVTLGVIGNATNPATMTAPTNWTEGQDVGYNTPTTGAETVARDSGFTSTTITWGSSSGSAFGSIIVELDTSSASGLYIDPLTVSALPAGVISGTNISGTYTWNITVGSCTNRVLIVGILFVDNSADRNSMTGVTYNGTAMNFYGRNQDFSGSELFPYLYVMPNPTTGTHQIDATFSDVAASGSIMDAFSIGFCGANTSYPFYLPSSSSAANTSSATFNLAFADNGSADGAILVGLASAHHPNTVPAGTQQIITNQNGLNIGAGQGFSASVMRAEIATTMTWTQNVSDVWATYGVPVRPATVTPTIPVMDFGAFWAGGGTSVTSATISNVQASGCTNGYMVYQVMYRITGGGSQSVSSVSWNSQSFTLIDSQRTTVGSDTRAIEFWGLKVPGNANATLTANFSGTFSSIVHGVNSFCLVNQSTPTGTVAKGSSTSGDNHPTVTVSSSTGATVFAAFEAKGDSLYYFTPTGTELWQYPNDSSSGNEMGAASLKPGAASVTMDWNLPVGTSDWNMMGMGINFGAASSTSRKRIVVATQ